MPKIDLGTLFSFVLCLTPADAELVKANRRPWPDRVNCLQHRDGTACAAARWRPDRAFCAPSLDFRRHRRYRRRHAQGDAHGDPAEALSGRRDRAPLAGERPLAADPAVPRMPERANGPGPERKAHAIPLQGVQEVLFRADRIRDGWHEPAAQALGAGNAPSEGRNHSCRLHQDARNRPEGREKARKEDPCRMVAPAETWRRGLRGRAGGPCAP